MAKDDVPLEFLLETCNRNTKDVAEMGRNITAIRRDFEAFKLRDRHQYHDYAMRGDPKYILGLIIAIAILVGIAMLLFPK